MRPAPNAGLNVPNLISATLLWVLGAVFFYFLFKGEGINPLSPVSARTFDSDPSCSVARLLAVTETGSQVRSLQAGTCSVERVTVENRYIRHGKNGNGTFYWVAVTTQSSGTHTIELFGANAQAGWEGLSVGQTLDALMYGQGVARLVVNGLVLSTSENPDIAASFDLDFWIFLAVLSVVATGFYYFRTSRQNRISQFP